MVTFDTGTRHRFCARRASAVPKGAPPLAPTHADVDASRWALRPGETDPRVVAMREAREETGLKDLHACAGCDTDQPLQIVIVPVPAHGDEPADEHADFRYLFATATPDAIVAESTDAPLRWIDLTVARNETTEENLRVFLSRAAEARS